MAPSLTANASTPSALAASSFSRTATSQAPKRERSSSCAITIEAASSASDDQIEDRPALELK